MLRNSQPYISVLDKKIEPGLKKWFSYKKKTCIKTMILMISIFVSSENVAHIQFNMTINQKGPPTFFTPYKV